MSEKEINEILDLVDRIYTTGYCVANVQTLSLDNSYLKIQALEIRELIKQKLKDV